MYILFPFHTASFARTAYFILKCSFEPYAYAHQFSFYSWIPFVPQCQISSFTLKRKRSFSWRKTPFWTTFRRRPLLSSNSCAKDILILILCSAASRPISRRFHAFNRHQDTMKCHIASTAPLKTQRCQLPPISLVPLLSSNNTMSFVTTRS